MTDEEIESAFANTNFGRTDYRNLLSASVLKKALNYHCGHTITVIMERCGLITEKGKVTEKGRVFCYAELANRSG